MTTKTIKGTSGIFNTTDHRTYDGPLGKVVAVEFHQSQEEIEAAKKMGVDYFDPYVTCSAMNTRDLDEAAKFANALLKAIGIARKHKG